MPRLTLALLGEDGAPPLGDVWGDTTIELPEVDAALGGWRDELTGVVAPPGTDLACRDVLTGLPFAVLAPVAAPEGTAAR